MAVSGNWKSTGSNFGSATAPGSDVVIIVTRGLIHAGQLLKIERLGQVIIGTTSADRPGQQSDHALGKFYQ
jgi:hypothetical protein